MMAFSSVRTLVSLGRGLERLLGWLPRAPREDPLTADLLRRASAARAEGRRAEAEALYRRVLGMRRHDAGALRGLRDLAADGGDWPEALTLQQRLCALAGGADRVRESEWLAAIHYELGRADLGRGDTAAAVGHFRSALRADRRFAPAVVALGDAWEAAGDHREAVRAWERGADAEPALPVLARLERAYRREELPSRLVALYEAAAHRAPDDLALAVALGRVYFELEMLDEAADQFEKIEVRAPDLPLVHAFLGAVFERRGETREAFDEYRRALRLGHAFDWPQECRACGASAPAWEDRCPSCRRWNALGPADVQPAPRRPAPPLE